MAQITFIADVDPGLAWSALMWCCIIARGGQFLPLSSVFSATATPARSTACTTPRWVVYFAANDAQDAVMHRGVEMHKNFSGSENNKTVCYFSCDWNLFSERNFGYSFSSCCLPVVNIVFIIICKFVSYFRKALFKTLTDRWIWIIGNVSLISICSLLIKRYGKFLTSANQYLKLKLFLLSIFCAYEALFSVRAISRVTSIVVCSTSLSVFSEFLRQSWTH